MTRFRALASAVLSTALLTTALSAQAGYHFGGYRARPPIHRYGSLTAAPAGLSPAQVKAAYHLPADGGHGTIAIIDAYDSSATIERDLAMFDAAYGLPACTRKDGCLEVKKMNARIAKDSGWALETALDVEWAHAIAPRARILLVEAATPSGKNLLEAIDAARTRKDVKAVSMSWGGAEFVEEASLDAHFRSPYGAVFFASSGDNGAGVSWPAASPNVVAVGGTTLRIAKSGAVTETAWSGSGGGISAYEPQPDFQKSYAVPKAAGKRAVPDVAYDADPRTGFGVYHAPAGARKGWYVLGGTSAGAPQWAAIQALGLSASDARFYADKASSAEASYFRAIRSGSNGNCGYFCDARRRYDEVTGLGSPLTVEF